MSNTGLFVISVQLALLSFQVVLLHKEIKSLKETT